MQCIKYALEDCIWICFGKFYLLDSCLTWLDRGGYEYKNMNLSNMNMNVLL